MGQGSSKDIYDAVNSGKPEAIDEAIAAGQPLNVPRGQHTPLMLAVKNNAVLAVRCLLKHGADPNVVAGNQTALHIAVRRDSAALVEILLVAGANPWQGDMAFQIPYDRAIHKKNYVISRVFEELTLPFRAKVKEISKGLFSTKIHDRWLVVKRPLPKAVSQASVARPVPGFDASAVLVFEGSHSNKVVHSARMPRMRQLEASPSEEGNIRFEVFSTYGMGKPVRFVAEAPVAVVEWLTWVLDESFPTTRNPLVSPSYDLLVPHAAQEHTVSLRLRELSPCAASVSAGGGGGVGGPPSPLSSPGGGGGAVHQAVRMTPPPPSSSSSSASPPGRLVCSGGSQSREELAAALGAGDGDLSPRTQAALEALTMASGGRAGSPSSGVVGGVEGGMAIPVPPPPPTTAVPVPSPPRSPTGPSREAAGGTASSATTATATTTGGGGDGGAPDVFCCPITMEVMTDPVIATDGFTYERVAITEWLRNHDTSPSTNEALADASILIPNHAVKSQIMEWREGR